MRLLGDPEDFITGKSRYWREAWRKYGPLVPEPVKRSRVRRFFLRLGLVLFSWPLMAADPALVQLPVLPSGFACGAVKRSADEVQPYCYGQFKGVRRLVTNSLIVVTASAALPTTDYYVTWGPGPQPLPDGTVPDPTCGVDFDCILWSFKLMPTGEIQYSVEINKGPLVKGALTGIYGQTAAAKEIGTLRADGTCGPFGITGRHPSIDGPPQVDPGCRAGCKPGDAACFNLAWVACNKKFPSAVILQNGVEGNCIVRK